MISAAPEIRELLGPIRRIHERVRDAVVAECEKAAVSNSLKSQTTSLGDTIYAIDRVSEELWKELFEHEVAIDAPLVLVAEGIEGGELVLPRGTGESDAVWRVVVDPIDGTRGVAYQKRSAWVLTGVAKNRGAETNLQDIELAIQTEIPLVKQHLSDTLWVSSWGRRKRRTLQPRYRRASGSRFATIPGHHYSPRFAMIARSSLARAMNGGY